MRSLILWMTLLCVFAVSLPAIAAPPASYERVDLADYNGTATNSRIRSNGDGSFVVAWVDPIGRVMTRARWEGTLRPAESHGTGHDPILWGEGTIYLAWASGNQVFLQSYSGTWTAPIAFSSGQGVPANHPGLCFVSGDYVPGVAWLESNQAYYCSPRGDGSYGAPELVCSDVSSSSWADMELSFTDGAAGLQPRLFYMNSTLVPLYRERLGPGSWGDPVAWSGDYPGCPWRVVPSTDDVEPARVLYLGPQPACPCNVIYLARQSSDGTWTSYENITVYRAHFNWPQYLSLADSPFYRSVHCFWYESFTDEHFDSTGEAMFYKVYQDGVGWSEPWTFDDVGIYNDVSIGRAIQAANQPEFCWIEKTPGGTRVMALRSMTNASSVPSGRLNAGPLRILPNPSSGVAVVSAPQELRLPSGVQIFDSSGRLLRTLVGSVDSPGRFVWDGKVGDGRLATAGMYLIRMFGQNGWVDSKIVIVR